jgi:hypothetical protein
VSELSIGQKLGVGFGVLFLILVGIVVFLLYRRRRIMSRIGDQSGNLDRNEERLANWLRGFPIDATKPKASIHGTNTTVTNDVENFQLITAG